MGELLQDLLTHVHPVCVCVLCVGVQEGADTENEAGETMGRVDEGVEEFFTKKILPDDSL